MRTVTALKWTLGITVLSGLVQLFAMTVLGRLLGPAEYGVYASTLAVAAITTGLFVGALERALVIADPDAPLHGITISLVALTCLISVATWLLFFSLNALGVPSPRLDILGAQLASASILVSSIPTKVEFRRALNFKTIVLSEFLGLVVATAITISLAYNDFGAWSLLLGGAAQNTVTTLLLISFRAPGASSFRERGVLADTVMSGLHIMKVSFLEVAFGRTPAIIISILCGIAPLGFFNRAHSVVQLPLELFVNSLTRVMISTLVAARGNARSLSDTCRNLVLLTGAVVTPVAAGMSGSSRELVAVVLGPQWGLAVVLLPILAISTWGVMTGHAFAVVAEADRRLKEKVKIQRIGVFVLISAVGIGGWFGVLWAAVGVAASSLFLCGLYFRLVSTCLEIPTKVTISWLLPGLKAGALTGAFCYSVSSAALFQGAPSTLVAQIIGSAILTGSYYAFFERNLLLGLSMAVRFRSRS